MEWSIEQIQPDQLGDYGRIPMRIRVERQFAVEVREGGESFELNEQRVDEPYEKDYDSYEQGGPSDWPDRFNVNGWGLFVARVNGVAVGAAAILTDTPDLGCRADEALLWDIRVHEAFQGRGLGMELFNRAAAWAQNHGARRLLIETQNVNVAACKFYERAGCKLKSANPAAYVGTKAANEIELVWVKDLDSSVP